jgi:serine/threonine protein kinase
MNETDVFIPPRPAGASAATPGPGVPGYSVLHELGRGGMGVVYKALDVRLGRLVALKMILSGVHASRAERVRFYKEAEALARLHHPGIVQIHQVGEEDGLPFLALEFCEGGSLADKLHGVPQPAPAAAQLAEALARAAHAAHTAGIVHRDLKPANVLLDRDGIPKLTDFGLAKHFGGEATALAGRTPTGAVVGTPGYMAPEQARGKTREIGPAVDIYGLGAILYELLTGRPPFVGESNTHTLMQVLTSDPPSPQSLQPSVPRDLETICLKCLQKEPVKRYPSAQALAEDLRRFLHSEPIRARPISIWERGRKWARRRPAVAALLAALAVVLVASIFGLTTLWLRADLQRGRAEANYTLAQQALDEMSSEVIDEWLGKQPKLEPRHEAFLKRVLDYYESLARQPAATTEARAGLARTLLQVSKIRDRLGLRLDAETAAGEALVQQRQLVAEFPSRPEYRADLARIYDQRGQTLQNLQRMPDAELAYRDARTVREELVAQFPDRPEYRQDLAMSHNNLANLNRETSRFEIAEAAYAQSLTILKELVREFPERQGFLQDLAICHNNLAILLRIPPRERLDQAEKAYRSGLEHQQQLVALAPEQPDYRSRLGQFHTNLGELLLTMGRVPPAEEEYKEALAIRKRLAAEFPARVEYRRDVGVSCNNLAGLFADHGRPDQARVLYADALKICKPLAADHPDVPRYQYTVGVTLNNLALLENGQKRPAEARRCLEEALPYQQAALRANAKHPFYQEALRDNREALAEAMLMLAEPAAAAALAEEMTRIAYEPAKDWFNAARILARCGPLAAKDTNFADSERSRLSRHYAERAMQFLRQAADKGFDDVDYLKKDEKVDALRTRPDFQKLVAELEKKTAKKSK